MARPLGSRKIHRYSAGCHATAARLGRRIDVISATWRSHANGVDSGRGVWAPAARGGSWCESCSVRSRRPRSLPLACRMLRRPRTSSR